MKKILLICTALCAIGMKTVLAQKNLQAHNLTRISEVLKDTMTVRDDSIFGFKILKPKVSKYIRFFECYSSDNTIGWVMIPSDSVQIVRMSAEYNGTMLTDTSLALVQQAEDVLAYVFEELAYSQKEFPRVFTAPWFYQFKRQYLFFISQKGDTCVFVNCTSPENLIADTPDRSFIVWYDGDDSRWHATINLTKKEIIEYSVNGPRIHYVKGYNKKRKRK